MVASLIMIFMQRAGRALKRVKKARPGATHEPLSGCCSAVERKKSGSMFQARVQEGVFASLLARMRSVLN
jgi:hypothetical protein